MPLISQREVGLNGEEVMALWVELGSLPKVWRYYKTKGLVNVHGQPYTVNGLRGAAMSFLARDPGKARKYYEEDGAVFSDEEWDKYVIAKMVMFYKTSRTSFIKWVLKNEWAMKYNYLFEEEYGIKAEDYDYYRTLVRKAPSGPGRRSIKHVGRPRKDRTTIPE